MLKRTPYRLELERLAALIAAGAGQQERLRARLKGLVGRAERQAGIAALRGVVPSPVVWDLHGAMGHASPGPLAAFLDTGVDLTALCLACSRWFETAFEGQIVRGGYRQARLMLEAGLDFRAFEAHGCDALCLVVSRGHLAAALLLLQHGGDPRRQNSRGQSPIDLAKTAPMRRLILKAGRY